MSNGARWTVTNDSMLKELDLSEDAQVEFSDNNKFVKVSVSKLKGDGGVFKMYGDIVKGESDKLITRKGSEGRTSSNIWTMPRQKRREGNI